MEFKDLELFLKNNKIPESKVYPKTFLGIAKQPHYENVISNIYAFFFTDTEIHQFKDLFISALVALINQKTDKKIELLGETSAETEISTNKNGRIDILLQNDDLSIIIENKIYHFLNNDLDDYWDSVSSAQKIGVVLSLGTIKHVGHSGFVNITHYELLTTIFNNIGAYLLNADTKYLVFLKDFYQNIINITNPMNTDALQFYYKHQEAIAQLTTIKDNLINHIEREVEAACGMLDESLILGNKRGADWRYYQSSKNRDLMFTIYFPELLGSDRKLHFIIELKSSLLEKSKKEEILKLNYTEIEKSLIKKDFETNNNTSWAHFALAIYNLTDEEIINLKDFIVHKIKECGLSTIFEKVEAIISE